jgi:hypothetical protein
MVVVSWVLLMKILTIKNIINVKNSLHVTLKKLFVKKKLYIWKVCMCGSWKPKIIRRRMCRDRIRQTIIEADTGLKSQPFWVGPNGWIHFFFNLCIIISVIIKRIHASNTWNE